MKLLAFNRRSPIGVDVGGKNIKAMQMSRGPRGWRIEATASFARVDEATGQLTATELRRLADVLRRRGFVGEQIVLAVPGNKLVTSAMELPSRSAGISLDAAARTEFAREHKSDPKGFEMAYWDLPAPARAGKTTHVMAVACAHADADEQIDRFAAAGLDVVGLDAHALALARACSTAAADATGIVAMLDLGWNAAVLVVLHQGIVVYERAVGEAGLKHLHHELSTQRRLGADVAMHLLHDASILQAQDAVAENREIRAVICEHFDLVGREFLASASYASHQYPDAPISRLLLTGGGSMIEGAADHLQSSLGFECRVVTPLTSASCAPSLARDCNASQTVAAGLAQFTDA